MDVTAILRFTLHGVLMDRQGHPDRKTLAWSRGIFAILWCGRSRSGSPPNIAEGQGRAGKKDFMRSLAIAHGSLNELESHLILAARVSFLAPAHETSLLAACNEVSRLLTRLRASLTKSPREQNKTKE